MEHIGISVAGVIAFALSTAHAGTSVAEQVNAMDEATRVKILANYTEICQKHGMGKAVFNLDPASPLRALVICQPTEPEQGELPRAYEARQAYIRDQANKGLIPRMSATVSSKEPRGLPRLPERTTADLADAVTWWSIDQRKWRVFIQNVSTVDLQAFEFSVFRGDCMKPELASRKALLTLEKPIPAGGVALVEFDKAMVDRSPELECGVISAAWTSGKG